MDDLEAIQKLAVLARSEQAPATDVSAAVLRHIREQPDSSVFVLWVFAAGASVAAAVVATMAIRTWLSWSDPISDLFSSFLVVMQ